jgi:hypothetical protein
MKNELLNSRIDENKNKIEKMNNNIIDLNSQYNNKFNNRFYSSILIFNIFFYIII